MIINNIKIISEFYRLNKNGKRRKYVKCICPYCGHIFITQLNSIKSGHTTSCGHHKINTAFKTHGLCNTRLYRIHCNMINRCYKPADPSYYKLVDVVSTSAMSGIHQV